MSKFTVFQIDGRKHQEESRDAMFFGKSDKLFSADRARQLLAAGIYAKVATVEADGLEDVYRLTNLWPEGNWLERHAPMHSLSVGDIVVDAAGVTSIVASFGFDTI